MENEGGLIVGDLATITKTVEDLGVMKPIREFLNLFFGPARDPSPKDTRKVYQSFFTLAKMKEIFKEGNYVELAKNYYKAARAQNEELCRKIFDEAKTFVPQKTPAD